MKTNQNFGLLFVLVLICQIILCNYTHLGPFIMLTMLPAMILCIPTGISTITCMLIAFAAGLATDFLAEGLLGLNAAALLPVALTRKGIIRIFLGEDLIARQDSFTFKKNGIGKISVALFAALAIFFVIYTALDGAGMRPTSFNLIRFFASLSASMALSLVVTAVLTPDDRK